MKIRKQVYELSLKDIIEFPVWEFALDEEIPVWEFALDEESEEGQDEATVRPFEFTPPLESSDGMFVVQADFLLADATVMKGFLTPSPDNKIGYIQPTIIVEKNQIGFWHGIQKPSKEEISSMYKSLGKGSKDIFPIKFKSMVELSDGNIEGVIDGFLYYSKDMKIKTIK